MSGDRQLDTGDRWFAAFMAFMLTIAGLLIIGFIIFLEIAIWDAGIGNGLIWHAIFAVIGWITSKVYVRVLKGMPKW